MPKPTVHIVFNSTGAEVLREALALAGRDELVLELPDNLSFGPIEPLDIDTRLEWALREFDEFPCADGLPRYGSFWEAALSPDVGRIIWMSKRSAQEYAGFLAYLSRLGDQECKIVDLTEFMLPVLYPREGEPKSFQVMSIAFMRPDQVVGHGLLDRSNILDPADRNAHCATWERLRAENAPFRIVDSNLRLISAPITIFDEQLLSYVTHQWAKAAYVIGQTMVESWGKVMQTGDGILAARLHALAEAGVIESQGDLFNIRHSEVRWPE